MCTLLGVNPASLGIPKFLLETDNMPSMIPFRESTQLYNKLTMGSNGDLVKTSPVTSTGTTRNKHYLPGEPRIEMEGNQIRDHLQIDFLTPTLNQLAPYLWLLSKQDSKHISPLTNQLVRGRNVVLTEEPGLHLVWFNDKIFIKPMPRYLLSYAFWKVYLIEPHSAISKDQQNEIKRAILGFMRTYAHLIRHRSDFDLATKEDHRLLPKNMKFSEFARFITAFESLGDKDVSARYHFGQLRLSRLNFWVKILLGHFTYQKVHGQYGAYFGSFLNSFLFVFAILSVLLTAMQVALAVGQPLEDGLWSVFAYASRGFATFSIICVTLVMVFFISNFVLLSSRETIYALKDLYRKQRAGGTNQNP